MGDFSDRVFAVVRRVPAGRVATYGQVARMMGSPRSARYVGFALRSNPSPAAEGGAIPCHRIVFADGRLCSGFAFGGPGVQRGLLESEGVSFLPDGRVNLKACQWTATPAANVATNAAPIVAKAAPVAKAATNVANAHATNAAPINVAIVATSTATNVVPAAPTAPPSDFDWLAELGD